MKEMPKKPSDQIQCFKHALRLPDVVDIPVNGVKVEITGTDEAYGHVWLRIECECPEKVRVLKEGLTAELGKIMKNMKPVDNPIDRLFDGTAMNLRMAKSGDRKGHFGIYGPRQPGVEDRNMEKHKQIWKSTKVDDTLRNLIGGFERCDIDVSVAGAFSFEEGTCAAVVCRRMYTHETKVAEDIDREVKEDFQKVDHEDATDAL